MTFGVKKVICTCGKEMIRAGGIFGGESILSNDTYVCSDCEKYVLVLTPNKEHQKEFFNRGKLISEVSK
jgi:hypothetical protein